MGRFIAFTGVLLIILAIVLMGSIIGVETVPLANVILVDMHCQASENQISTANRLAFSGTQNSTTVFFCEDADSNQREITDEIVTTTIIAFLVPFLLGLFMLIGGLTRSARNAVNQLGINNIQMTTRPDGSYQANLSPEQQATLNQVMGAFGATTGASSPTLSERLKQLEEARNEGLISRAEYDQARQALLDAMDDNL